LAQVFLLLPLASEAITPCLPQVFLRASWAAMQAYFAWTMTIAVAFAASVASAADEQDCDTPSMSDETSLLVSNLHIDHTENQNILQASEEMTPGQEELDQAVSTKLKNIDQTEGNKLPEEALETGQIPAADLLSRSVATDQGAATSWLSDPQNAEKARTATFEGNVMRIVCQLVFGIIYYLIFVNGKEIKKTLYDDPNADAQANFAKGPIAGCLGGGLANCICAWACTGSHASRTFHMTDTCSYWPGCICMAFCPCITLFFMHSCTNLEERLGGETGHKENICLSFLCSAFCSCCVVAHDAGNLDKVYGQKTGFCGVEP